MGRVKLRPAEQKMKIWFLLSLGLLSLSAGDQERSGGECLAESAVDVRRDLFQGRQWSRNPWSETPPSSSGGLRGSAASKDR